MKLISYLAIVSLLTGCAASGPKYQENIAEQGDQSQSGARLVIFRTKESSQYSARAAAIKLDEQSSGGCDYGGYKILNATPGPHTLAVDMWDSPGVCKLSIDVADKGGYFFEVKPRTENLASGFAFGLVGMAIESSGKQCGGAFSIEAVEKQNANAQLSELRLSE